MSLSASRSDIARTDIGLRTAHADGGRLGVIRRRGDPNRVGDRLDSPPQRSAAVVFVFVDEPDHFVDRRSSSAPKKCAAAFEMSLARFSSAFSRFKRFSSASSSVVAPGRRPLSVSARMIHWRTVSAFGPSLSATEQIASHRTRTRARDRAPSSPHARAARRDYLLGITPSSQGTEPPRIPGRFEALLAAGPVWILVDGSNRLGVSRCALAGAERCGETGHEAVSWWSAPGAGSSPLRCWRR